MSESFKSIFYDTEQRKWVVDERLEIWTRQRLKLTAVLGELYLLSLGGHGVHFEMQDIISKIKKHDERRPR